MPSPLHSGPQPSSSPPPALLQPSSSPPPHRLHQAYLLRRAGHETGWVEELQHLQMAPETVGGVVIAGDIKLSELSKRRHHGVFPTGITGIIGITVCSQQQRLC